MPNEPAAVVAHDEAARRLGLAALAAGRASWRRVEVSDISASWSVALRLLLPTLTAIQRSAAVSGGSYTAGALAEQGVYEAPEAFVDPARFVGVAPDGRSLEALLYSPATTTKRLIGEGMDPLRALQHGGTSLDVITRTVVADTARAAAGVDIAVRQDVGYVRMLVPPSCSRCALLAGKFYRWNAGFPRHPRCDCKHIPTRENQANDLTTDPYEYFRSLSPQQQEKQFGPAEAKAIRDGADIFQVVNARRGMKPGGLVTAEGTSKRGAYGRGKPPRLTPEGIYSQGKSREETLILLEKNGYILPGGQDPEGVLGGAREGYGQMGRGGTRVGARQAVERARASGVRDPAARATMTAAERRYFDAQMNWDAVSRGRNPFGRGSLSPQLAAAVENDFRRIVLNGDTTANITARQKMAGR
ncbi:hypothetical protein LJ753_10920 [Arthrobacter sp. zg-Y20]|uniref:VG15 protein n=1 Tax=unclassified Arthrobacter TaxID=235627 RepID=UPI001D15918B|nr:MULTISPECIES: hypothetical protein [unclassified Arthrobacter]MCC3276382.1 hypothetical protein [Arthrobacter sp. zg-Y20]MDK1316541.1 hypothetical protein [Arthrobacter sp. zg.Y20]WIB06581.1 hypothetical protein QNO06_02220 [Arthrobacter sp. zg-Y20]